MDFIHSTRGGRGGQRGNHKPVAHVPHRKHVPLSIILGEDKERDRLKEVESHMWLALPPKTLNDVKQHHVKGNELYAKFKAVDTHRHPYVREPRLDPARARRHRLRERGLLDDAAEKYQRNLTRSASQPLPGEIGRTQVSEIYTWEQRLAHLKHNSQMKELKSERQLAAEKEQQEEFRIKQIQNHGYVSGQSLHRQNLKEDVISSGLVEAQTHLLVAMEERKENELAAEHASPHHHAHFHHHHTAAVKAKAKQLKLQSLPQPLRVGQISCGAAHTLFLTPSGKLFSCGKGRDGRLGHDEELSRVRPRPVITLQLLHCTRVAAGGAHSLAVTEDGFCYTWGAGSHGQLGHDDSHQRLRPHRVEHMIGNIEYYDDEGRRKFKDTLVRDVAAGQAHSLISCEKDIRSSAARLLGSSSSGKSASGSDSDSDSDSNGDSNSNSGSRPGSAASRGSRRSRSSSRSSSSSSRGGCTEVDPLKYGPLDMYSFGKGQYGRLGHGARGRIGMKDVYHPIKVHIPRFEPPEADDEDGDGIVSYAEAAAAKLRTGPVGVVLGGMSAGFCHSLAVTNQNLLLSFGLGTDGQLGHGERRSEADPTYVIYLSMEDKKVAECSAGKFHSLVLTTLGKVYSFGRGTNGRLGQGCYMDNKQWVCDTSYMPQEVVGLDHWDIVQGEEVRTEIPMKAIAAGDHHSLFVSEEGQLYGCGVVDDGRLGISGKGAEMSAANANAACMALAHNAAAAEAHIEFKMSALNVEGVGEDEFTPKEVTAVEAMRSGAHVVAAGGSHSGAWTGHGEPYMWGSARDGRLGFGFTKNLAYPVANLNVLVQED